MMNISPSQKQKKKNICQQCWPPAQGLGQILVQSEIKTPQLCQELAGGRYET